MTFIDWLNALATLAGAFCAGYFLGLLHGHDHGWNARKRLTDLEREERAEYLRKWDLERQRERQREGGE